MDNSYIAQKSPNVASEHYFFQKKINDVVVGIPSDTPTDLWLTATQPGHLNLRPGHL